MRQLIKFNAMLEAKDRIVSKQKPSFFASRQFTDLDLTVAIVGDGIYNGVYFPTEELEKTVHKWDRKPLCIDHSDSVLHEIGYISNPRMVDNKLVVEPHIADYTRHAKDALAWIRLRKESGQTPEVSISAWVDIETEEIEGHGKVRVARNIEPVHLALVTQGACSPEDGCGIGKFSYQVEYNPDYCNSITPSVFYSGDAEEDDMKEKENLGVVPSNPPRYGKDATSPWKKPTLRDFTDKTWEQLTDAEKKRIASCFAWAPKMPPERFTDLKLPHHDPKSRAVVWRGVVAAMAALFGARGGVDIPSEDRKKVYNHLAKHYRDFDKEPPEFHALEEGGVEMAEKLLEELEEQDESMEQAQEQENENAELRQAIEEYKAKIDECRKAREELEKRVRELEQELEQVKQEKEKLEQMRGKPKVANEKEETKGLVDEYKRLRELMKKA